MKVIVGLGNIGEEYINTPHNVGFLFVEKLYEFFEHMTTADCSGCMCAFKGMFQGYQVMEWKKEKIFDAEIVKIKHVEDEKKDMLLVKPVTMMNLSGSAVQKISKKFEFDLKNDLFVAYDDLDLELGKYKVTEKKSPRDHNGINDVISKLGTPHFNHVRIGIDNREKSGKHRIPGEDYVLKPYSEEELITLHQTVSEIISGLFI
jgi:PTH1 family peptidyl-tRNA hydrolase